ncbi:MAG: hypothetical protein M1825_004490 [Sarcosagium campestre]|nr:MAG: hypothetical protein M1825_004490 [Sarcosagium campestre]
MFSSSIPTWTSASDSSTTTSHTRLQHGASFNRSRRLKLPPRPLHTSEALPMSFLYPSESLALLRRLRATSSLRGNRAVVQHMSHRLGKRTFFCQSKLALSQAQVTVSDRLADPELHGHNIPTFSPRDLDVDDVDEDAAARALDHLLSPTNHADYDKFWRLHAVASSPEDVLAYLSTSPRRIDAERSMQLFYGMPMDRRNAVAYTHAIVACIKLGRINDALNLHDEASVAELREPFGSGFLIALLVEMERWEDAFHVWCRVREEQPHLYETDVRQHVQGLHALTKRAISLAKLTLRNAAQESVGAPNAESIRRREFAADMIRCATLNKGREPSRPDMKTLYALLQELDVDTYSDYEPVIVHFLDAGIGRVAIDVYRLVRQRRACTPSMMILDRMMDHMIRFKSERGIEMVMEDWRRFYNRPRRSVYRISMEYYAERGLVERVGKLFKACEEAFGPSKDVRDLIPLLHVEARCGNVEKTKAAFDTYAARLEGGKTPIQFWNVLLNAYGKAEDLDGAFRCYTDILAQSKPNEVTFGTMMGMCANRGDVEAVEGFLEEAESQGIKRTAQMQSTLVMALVNNNDLEAAEQAVDESLDMQLKGPTTSMWNHILYARAFGRDLEGVMRTYRRMQQLGVPFNEGTYGALMKALVILKQNDQANKILRVIMPREGIRPNAYHYGIVMRGYLSAKQIERVFKLLKRMIRTGVTPTLSSVVPVIKASLELDLRAANEGGPSQDYVMAALEETVATADAMDVAEVGPSSLRSGQPISQVYPAAFFDYIIFMYAQEGNYEQAHALFDRYLKMAESLRPGQTVEPPLKMMTAMMVLALKEGKYAEVSRIWHIIVRQSAKLARAWHQAATDEPGWVSPSRRYLLALPLTHYMKALSAEGKLDDLVKTVEGMRRDGYVLDRRNWNMYIQILAQHGRCVDAFELCERHLMAGWQGWEFQRNRSGLKTGKKKFVNEFRSTLRPIYHTLVFLARALLDLRDAEIRRTGISGTTWLQLREDCPRTMKAVETMQRHEDDAQSALRRL